MYSSFARNFWHLGGIFLSFDSDMARSRAEDALRSWLAGLNVLAYLNISAHPAEGQFLLRIASTPCLDAVTPEHDTTGLSAFLALDVRNNGIDLETEIVLSLARSPIAFHYPGLQELQAGVRMRRYSAIAARNAELSFDTEGLERPEDCWTYHPETSFTLLPDVALIDALVKTTQPALSGRTYTFSCYRASEYVMLLALALELREYHPRLLEQIEARWRRQAIMSEEFHRVFTHEYGSVDQPLPQKFYVPGDRLWFKNPDERSSDVRGYEGSWLYYVGGGQFNNFWNRKVPYTLTTKCLEIYHWRDAVVPRLDGTLTIDETIVSERVALSMDNPDESNAILDKMMRLRDPSGVYAQGGCIDRTRERLKWVGSATSDLVIPDSHFAVS